MSKEKRLKKCQNLVNLVKSKKAIIIFGRKDFHMDSISNSGECKKDSVKYKFLTKHPASIMFGLILSKI
jgi:hypothetical protein